MTSKNDLNKLWLEFLTALQNKCEIDGYYNDYSKELRKIYEIIEKEKNEEKKVLIIKGLINFINTKISKGVYSKEIICTIETKAKELKMSKFIKEKESDEEFKESTINKIEELYNALDGYSREELQELEEEYNTSLKDKSTVFGQEKARGQIIGELNKGMYDDTRENLVKHIKENGEKIKTDDRFISYMSLDLIKFRIIGLRLVGKYCDKTYEKFLKTAKDSLARINEDDYSYMRKRTNNLGIILKNLYESKFGVTPREEILNNIFGQLMIPQVQKEFYPKRDDKRK